MTISAKDKHIIRTLAKKVAEIASDPINSEKRDMWMRLNRLQRVRPLIQIQAIDWNIWEELIPSDQLETTDPFSRQHELELRKRLYCWENFRDDHVVDNVITCPIVINGDFDSADFGIKRDIEEPEDPSGAHAFRPVIIAEKDIDKIQTDWKISVDWEQTERQYEQLYELFDGTLIVEKRGPNFFWFAPMDFFYEMARYAAIVYRHNRPSAMDTRRFGTYRHRISELYREAGTNECAISRQRQYQHGVGRLRLDRSTAAT